VAKAAKHAVRLIIPDSHGAHADWSAVGAMLGDLKNIQVDEVVWLGDHLDCGGVFSTHQRTYTLDMVAKACPGARQHYIAGNHETHLERWASRTFQHKVDADRYLERQGPEAVLRLKQRGIKYYKCHELYGNMATPGVLRLGRVHFTHGWAFGRHATAAHLASSGVSIVHGHTHRAQAVYARTMASSAVGAHCPGTLAKLQPLYRHNSPTDWTHGFALQLVNQSTQSYLHLHIPIVKGVSMLSEVPGAMFASARRMK
jgi:calcineurin-like phosphoesterase family protein